MLILLGVAGLLGGGRALAEFRDLQLRRLAPKLDPEMRRHLAADSDHRWLDYARRVGTGPLGDAMQVLRHELRTESFSDFAKRRPALQRASLRIALAFHKVFDFPAPERSIRYEIALSPKRDFELRQMERRYIEVSIEAHMGPGERIRSIDSLSARFLALGDPDRALYSSLVATPCELELGRPDRHRERLEAGLRSSRQLRQVYITCQTLGELGVVHWNAANEDTMRACFDEGIATALRHGFIDQAARLLKFYASYYASQGRLALSVDRLAEAQRLCRGPGGENARIRLQVEYTKFVADLGCWDLVDRGLRRLPPLLRELPKSGRQPDVLRFGFDADRLRARLAFAQGRAEEGTALMQRLANSVPAPLRRVWLAEVFDDWSAGLESSDRPREALEICERGVAHCDSAHVPERESPLLLRRASLLERLGKWNAAGAALDSAETRLRAASGDSHRLWREARVLRAKLSLQAGRKEAAKRLIAQVFHEFRAGLRQRDGGALSYLELDEAHSLREAMHEIQEFTPERGYQFELEWRSLPADLGGHRPAVGQVSAWSGESGAPRSRLPVDEPHVVYWFGESALLRWTARHGGVVLDTLPLSLGECALDVREALELLQVEPAPPGNALGPTALERLRLLSKLLLPDGLHGDGERIPRLHFSPDGPLLALPFEALPAVGPRGEEPLALWADVAYSRGTRAIRSRAGGPAVVVTNPALSSDLQQRYGLARPLVASESESQAALARWPEAIVLSGEHATKDSIRARWPGASIIHLAAHHVRDPDAPFLGFVPLAAPAGAPPDAAVLEIADIRQLDLSACRLAVLASCASGAPYRTAHRPGPSLADAFLDSGAAAVVRSFWDVGDSESSPIMKAFLAEWQESEDPAAALGRARRKVMKTPEGASPRVWAAWSVVGMGMQPE